MNFYYGKMIFEVAESVYYPREDSLLLAKVVENLKLKGKKVLEIGCGCGFLSILCAKQGAAVTAVDINEEATSITKTNARANKTTLNAFESDLFSKVSSTFDLIIFNAPYLPEDELDTAAKIRGEGTEHLNELNIVRQWSGGPTGREVIEEFVKKVKNYLNPKGGVLLGISSLTGEKEVIELFEKQKMTATSVAREKIPWEELIVIEARI